MSLGSKPMGSELVDWKSTLMRHSGGIQAFSELELKNEPGCRRSPAWRTVTSSLRASNLLVYPLAPLSFDVAQGGEFIEPRLCAS
jgi:hypothetical protein